MEDALSHCLDEAIRLTRVAILPKHENGEYKRDADTIISAITQTWIRHYGPMKYLTAFGESALAGLEAAKWASRHSIELRTKPVGAHAQMVERHHELY